LKSLHDNHIAHRDIKAENILICETVNEAMLIDFGFSSKYEPGSLLKTSCGSPNYCAPEILAKEIYDPEKADLWSSGVLLFYMLCGSFCTNQGYLPFFDDSLADLYTKIIFEDLVIPSHVNKDAADLIKGILERSPKDRLSLEQVLNHPWMVVRKLYAQDLDELDWEVEYNLARSEALGSVFDRILVH
jgi:serine/threonine protein kinase